MHFRVNMCDLFNDILGTGKSRIWWLIPMMEKSISVPPKISLLKMNCFFITVEIMLSKSVFLNTQMCTSVTVARSAVLTQSSKLI